MIALVENWPERYIGDEWINGKHDCWAFCRRVWAEVFSLVVPVIDLDALNMLDVMRALRNDGEREKWASVLNPTEGCAVLMSQSNRPSHVGVWTEIDGGGVVHCVKGIGVIFSSVSALSVMGYRILVFYERNEND